MLKGGTGYAWRCWCKSSGGRASLGLYRAMVLEDHKIAMELDSGTFVRKED